MEIRLNELKDVIMKDEWQREQQLAVGSAAVTAQSQRRHICSPYERKWAKSIRCKQIGIGMCK